MLKIYLKLIFRRLVNDKANSLINLLGLSVGLSVALLIGMYVYTEWQTDRDLPHPEHTYRLLRVSSINNEPYDIGVTSAPFATGLKQDFGASIKETVRVLDGSSLVQHGNQRFQEDDYYYADANFLTFFGFDLIHGNPETALARPNAIVLTQNTARRYFGDVQNAMGQILRIDNSYDAVVTGVLNGSEAGTHFEFDFVESLVSLENAPWWSEWWNNNLCTYLRLEEGVSPSGLEAQLPAFMDKHFGDDFARTGRRLDLRLQPIQSVYLDASTRYDPMRHGSGAAIRIFTIAALLLVFIALFNYVNLSTAKTLERRTEVGVYKALGSDRKQIIFQILGETFVLTCISLFAAIAIALYTRSWFEGLFEAALRPNFPAPLLIGGLIGLIVLLTVLAGLYPGVLLSSFKPVHALKGVTDRGKRSIPGIRRALVVVQFVLSIGLLCCTFVIHQQMTYLGDAHLGFDRDHVMLMRTGNPDIFAQRLLFEERLAQVNGIQTISYSSGEPGGFHDASTIQVEGVSEGIRMRTVFADFDYVSAFGLEIIAGRDFSSDLASDSVEAVLLNEQAVTELGLTIEDVLNRKLSNPLFDVASRRVVGVVRNYNFSSLHDTIEPLIISAGFGGRTMAVKVQADRLPAAIEAAEAIWNDLSSAYPFSYTFLDERLDQLYTNERRQSRIFGLFAGVAIFIACLGMFGLATYAAARRMKEIGIRKVLGASILDLVLLLSKSYLLQVMVAALVAIPLAYITMQRWLGGFAYHIDLNAGVFLLASVLAAMIALTVVGVRAARVALLNPVESLRYE